MTTLAPAPRLRLSTGHFMPIVAFAFVFLGTSAVGVATIAADPVFVEAEIAVSHLEGRDATNPRADADHEVDLNRVSASGWTGRPSRTASSSPARDDRHGSTHEHGAAVASHHEVRAFLHGMASHIHAPASAKPSLPDCFPCPATRAYAERHGAPEAVGTPVVE